MIRVLAVTSEWPSPDNPAAVPFLTRQIDGVRQHGVEVDVEHFRGATNPRNYARARRRVRRRLQQAEYDIVHAHFGQAGLTVVPASKPLVVTFYGSDLEGVIGSHGKYSLRGRSLTALSRIVARLADEVIVVSESLSRRLPRRVQYTVIPTAVDLNVFKPGSKSDARKVLGLPGDRRLVLFAGRPDVAVKRYPLARAAVDLLSMDAPVDLLTISGLSPTEVAAHMQSCDALLLTSIHEGSPTVVKEAIACALPVVSVDVGDVRETLGNTPGCVVIDDDTPLALSRALTQAFEARPGVGTSPSANLLDQAVQSARVVEVYEAVLRRKAARERSART